MSPKLGRYPNAGTSVPKQVMEQVDCYVVTDPPGVRTGLALTTSVRKSYRASMSWTPLMQSGLVRTRSMRH